MPSVVTYPVTLFVVIIVIYLIYRYMKKQQRESNMDDGWLADTNT